MPIARSAISLCVIATAVCWIGQQLYSLLGQASFWPQAFRALGWPFHLSTFCLAFVLPLLAGAFAASTFHSTPLQWVTVPTGALAVLLLNWKLLALSSAAIPWAYLLVQVLALAVVWPLLVLFFSRRSAAVPSVESQHAG